MIAASLVGGVLWLSLTAYAVLAGADFGGGVWDIFASGPRRDAQRRAVAQAMGPVWEANHVWLIFMVTGLFTAFPVVFAVLGTALFIPVTIALIGIVLRGAAFAFSAHAREGLGKVGAWGAIFGASSLLAPAFLAAAGAAVAMGSIHAPGGHLRSGFTAGWTTPFAVDLGLLAVCACAYLAATYLLVETEADPDLQQDFRGRALAAGVVAGLLSLAGLVLAHAEAPRLWTGLVGRALPLLVLALLNGPVALVAVYRARPRLARASVAAQVALVLWAWALAQWPALVPPDLTIANAHAPAATLTGLLIVVAAGMVLLLPSLWLLFSVFKGRNPAVRALLKT